MMPCFSKNVGVISCKLVVVIPGNSSKGLSSHIVNVVVFDANTGELKVVMVNTISNVIKTITHSKDSTEFFY
jgi:ornithine cyclodeaminase/alanine dehydrogenase-like protein (mu-crystallin family)